MADLSLETTANYISDKYLIPIAEKTQDKALVEGAVKLVYQRIYYELSNITFFSLAELNKHIQKLLERYNSYKLQTTGISRSKQFAEIEKEYLARVEGIVIRKKIVELRKGVVIDDGYLAIPKEVRLLELDKTYKSTLISITLTEGKNKQVRKMFEALGHPVKKLTRVRYDFLTLEGVERGTYRQLKIHEVKQLYAHSQPKI